MTLADRLRAALARPRGAAGRDDHPWEQPYTRAAVLIAITDRPEPGVLLTVRHAGLRRHAGQIAFPGGRVDPHDADDVAAALREAEEEIGLAPERVEVVGRSDLYHTGSGYEIAPVVGVVPPDLPLVPHEAEVADLFEAPLAFLLAAANHVPRTATTGGRQRTYVEILWNERRVWGATAAMLVNLARRLEGMA